MISKLSSAEILDLNIFVKLINPFKNQNFYGIGCVRMNQLQKYTQAIENWE